MSIKLILTSITLCIIAAIFGTIFIQETARISSWQNKNTAEMVEQGANVYIENCATCHGKHAKAEICFSTNNEQIACAGRPLNTPNLLCGEPSQRLKEVAWEGSKQEYFRAITVMGNSSQGMPAFDKAYRYDALTALTNDQIENVIAYLLNFETFPCHPPLKPVQKTLATTVADLPAGNAINGEVLYNITYGCSACHGDINIPESNAIGPWGAIFKDLDNRIDGYTAADYAYESILLPSAHISPSCPTGPCTGPPSGMPNNFGLRMTNQDMADLLAYLGVDSQMSNGIEIEIYQE